MTTTVTVKTHSWPARVMGFPIHNGKPVEGAEYQPLGEVPPNSEATFHPHAQMDVLVQELPMPVARPTTTAE